MANILALVPIKPDLPAALYQGALRLLGTLAPDIERHAEVCDEVGDGRPYSAHAAARNAMLDRYLRPEHSHVLWIDADLTSYPPDLAAQLLAIDPDGIVAPFVLIEGTDRFYDTRGFVDLEGRRALPWPPYLMGGDRIPMQSVGCCYLAPARAFQPSRYAPIHGHTEHYSICAAFGGLIWAARSVTVEHANLPRYGEPWHADPSTT